MIHLYYGDGKGKTSAALGLCLRYSGAGGAVVFAQFLKGRQSGEIAALSALGISVFRQTKPLPFTFQMNPAEKKHCAGEQTRIFYEAVAAAAHHRVAGTPCLLVLDEYIDALQANMLDEAAARAFFAGADGADEIVITGHSAPGWLCEHAAYITECKKHKHPYDTGLAARKGIEF